MVAWVLAAVLAGAPAWKQVQRGDVDVFTRDIPGERTAELKAVSIIDATPREVRDVLEDDAFVRSSSSHLVEFRTVERPAPNVVVRYGRISFPFFEDRDYFVETTLERDLDAKGQGEYRSSWKPWGLDRPTRASVVRVARTSGYWLVTAAPGGKARVEYDVACDPGGSLPGWAVDLVQKRVVPDLLRTLGGEVARRRTAGLSAAAH